MSKAEAIILACAGGAPLGVVIGALIPKSRIKVWLLFRAGAAMTDIGTLSVNVLAGLVLLGLWLAEHPCPAVLAGPAASTVTAAIIGVAFARDAIIVPQKER